MRPRASPNMGTKSKVATSSLPSQGPTRGRKCYITLHSRGFPEEGTKSELTTSPLLSLGRRIRWKCYVTPAFSGHPKIGDKIRSGCLTPAFPGAHKWVEVQCNPYVSGGPQKKGGNQKWLPHPWLLGGP